MKSIQSCQIKVTQILIGVALVAVLATASGAIAGDGHDPLVTDWSHRHLVFSEPNSLMKRFELSTNPRYVQQLRRRHADRHDKGNDWRWRRAPDGTKSIQGDWSMNMGSGATVGAGNYPAKYSFDPTTASCATDFVVYNTSLAGLPGPTTGQATIVAYNNIYSSCSGGTPQVYWAYNTGSTGAVVTSPVLSYDGTQVAFVQSTPTAATLVILRWKASTGTPSSPVTLSAGSCTPATAPCMTTVTFSSANTDTNPTDTFSSPFYDYPDDTIYVGDTDGFLHKFTGVFFGTPTEVVSTGPSSFWPASLTGGFGHLNSPVFANGYGEVLVTGNDGVFYAVDATAGGVVETGVNFTAKLASFGFDDGPLVDLTSGFAYVFARADNPTVGSGVASLYQIPIPATPSDLHFETVTEEVVSNSATIPTAFYIGTFDDPYYSSTNATGDLYACSTSGAVNALWVITIANGVMSTPNVGPALTTANVGCSPITEFNNANASGGSGADLMFLSVTGSPITASPINCPSAATGCIMSFDIDNILASGSGTTATATEAGGTSGIVVDNYSATGGASQVYFTPLSDQTCTTSGGTGGCAIQASQSALR